MESELIRLSKIDFEETPGIVYFYGGDKCEKQSGWRRHRRCHHELCGG